MPETTWSDGDVATAAKLNQIEDQIVVTCTSSTRPTGVEGRKIYETDTDKEMIYDGTSWNLAGGATWKTFTPSWNNLTVGNGTQSGVYRFGNGSMRVLATITFGSTTSVSGAVSLIVPASLTTHNTGCLAIGNVRFIDATSTDSYGRCDVGTAADTTINVYTSAVVAMNTTVPFTWTTSDVLNLDITVPLT